MGMFDGLGSAVAGGLFSFIGGERRNDAQAEQAAIANAFSAQQFATRYQTTVKDMAAAGLNPMLAYSQGGGPPLLVSKLRCRIRLRPRWRLLTELGLLLRRMRCRTRR